MIELVQGDITRLEVDAIVNAANSALRGGGGVDGAIHRAAGPELLKSLLRFDHCNPGDAVLTPGFKLKARFVIHAVGPVWRGGDRGESALLASCYRRAFALADAHALASIAFPAISCGAYGYPLEPAVEIAVRESRDAARRYPRLERIVFACFDARTRAAYEAALR